MAKSLVPPMYFFFLLSVTLYHSFLSDKVSHCPFISKSTEAKSRVEAIHINGLRETFRQTPSPWKAGHFAYVLLANKVLL